MKRKRGNRLVAWGTVLLFSCACISLASAISGGPNPIFSVPPTLPPTDTASPATLSARATEDVARATDTPVSLPTNDPVWAPLLGRVYSGVKMYYGAGEEKAYGFEILGGNDNCPSMPSGRGLYVQYEDGTLEWKDRQAMVQSPYNFVRRDDPALEKIEWYEYPCP